MEGSLNVGGICLDKNAHTVTIDGKNIEMSFKEFELLTYFMENSRYCSVPRKDSEPCMEL